MELIPGLHWIQGLGSNLFLWRDQSGYVLVDTGAPRDWSKVLNYLQSISAQPSDISHILITHTDFDHAGSAARLQAATGARIICGQLSAEFLIDGRSPKHLPVIIRSVADLIGRYSAVPQTAVVTIIDNEFIDGLDGWRALATPGHCIDHFSYYLPGKGILFAGDALNMRGGQLKLHPRFITGDRAAARQSAIKLLKLSPVIINCGHGPPLKDHNADLMLSFYHRLKPPPGQKESPEA